MPIQSQAQFLRQAGAHMFDANGRLSLNAMRPMTPFQNALLRHEEWLRLDAAVHDTFRAGLVGISDLTERGLVEPLGGIGTIVSGYEVASDMEAAELSMDGRTRGQQDRVEFDTRYVPVPIFHKDFDISARHLEASRRLGQSLDVTHVQKAARKVRDLMQSVLFLGTTKELAGYNVYGYTTHAQRFTDTATNYGGGDFGTAGNGYKAIQGALNAMAAYGFDGPFGIYVANTQFGQLLNVFGTASDKNEYTVILENIPNIAFIKRGHDLTAGELVIVQLTKDVVDLAIAQDVTTVQWTIMGGFVFEFRVMSVLAPRIKEDDNNIVGVLHMTGC